MRLKRVTIFGFKTFADKTEVDFSGDLIAVIGPNGCGKSNIVDAILWGLGEPNARHLRAQTGTDVIFAGSAKRRALGYAEVSLYFDNEDGMLPVPTREVVVTRKVTRAGESTFAINRQNCRLRDIYDLLADSGLGKSGYAIVGQKEIDQALAASPDERRAWVDEAAGVQRYRQRKTESFRRLSQAEDHLSRVKDILQEVESQREPLREEAERAREYRRISETLRRVESSMLVRQVVDLGREVTELEARIQNLVAQGATQATQAERAEHLASQAQTALRELEERLMAIRAEQHRLSSEIDRQANERRLNDQRLASLDELEATLVQDAQTSAARLAEYEREVAHCALEREQEEQRLSAEQDATAGAASEAAAFRLHLDELDRRLEEARHRHAERIRQEAAIAQRADRIAEIEREVEGITATLPDLENGRAEAGAARDTARQRYEELARALETAEEQIRVLREEQARAEESHRRDLAQVASLEGRHRALEYTLESHEGLAQGARAVLEAVERGEIPGEFLPVAQAITTDRRYAVAIETALGAAANDLIVAHEGIAKGAIEWLKRGRHGRATFQPLTLVRPPQLGAELYQVARRPGILGRAAELVRAEAAHGTVVESLLGRILVAETLNAALAVAKTGGWSRIVTLDGEVVHSGGAVTGGATQKQAFGILQRRAELDEIARQIDQVRKTIEQTDRETEQRRLAIEERRLEVERLRPRLATARQDFEEAERWARDIAQEFDATVRSKDKLHRERERLLAESHEEIEVPDLARIEAERDSLLHRLAARSADAERAERTLREGEHRLEQARLREEQAQRRLASLRESEQARERRLTHLEPERAKIRTANEAIERRMESLRGDRVREDAAYGAAVAERGRLEAEADLRRAEAKAASQAAIAASEALHQTELTRARAEAKRAGAVQRLLEEYAIDEAQAERLAPEIEVPEDAASVTQRLRRELREMGEVNLGAIEAYERLTERAGDLGAQVHDVEEGIAQIRASIAELDALTRDRFVDTYSKVETAFTETFQRLFGGGDARLSLSNPQDMLNSGIDIDVQLPGKKRQKLELLSGGERSLCATAFLFALLKVKPSPLVVLDEVDAPLDGRNVERYVDLLRDYSAKSQFIVITHNPTTIVASSAWLGVTMQEGVTTVIPMSVPVEADGQRILVPEPAPLSAGLQQ